MKLRGRFQTAAFVAALIITAIQAGQDIAQTANSNAGLQVGQDGMFGAILATPIYTPQVLPAIALATRAWPRTGSPHPPVHAECSGPGPLQFKRSVSELRRQQDAGGQPAHSPRLDEPAVRY